MKKHKILTMTFAAGLLAFGLVGCAQKEKESGAVVEESDKVVSTTDASGDEETATESDFNQVGEFKEVATDSKNPKIKSTYTFNTDYKDDSWENVDFTIDKAKVVDTEKYKEKDDDEEYSGALALHYSFVNKGDKKIKLHPEEAVMVLEDGTEIKAKKFRNTLSSIFDKGERKGNIQFKFKKSDQDDLANIKEIRLNFKAKVDGEKEEHEYDVKTPAKSAEKDEAVTESENKNAEKAQESDDAVISEESTEASSSEE